MLYDATMLSPMPVHDDAHDAVIMDVPGFPAYRT